MCGVVFGLLVDPVSEALTCALVGSTSLAHSATPTPSDASAERFRSGDERRFSWPRYDL